MNGTYKHGKDIIGKEYPSRKGFPKATDKTTEGQYIKLGETFKIIDYDDNTEEYTILNLSLGTKEAWIKINQSELDYVLRQGDVL